MITIKSNLGQVAARLHQKILSVQDKDKMLRLVAANALPEVKFRIHTEGKDANGGQIGTYSDGYMAVRTGKFKSNSKVTKGKKKGETRKTGVFTKGKNKGQARPNYNRTDDTKVILSLTSKMENEFVVIADGNRYGLGFLTPDSAQKARYCEATYQKDIYKLTSEEKDSALTTATRFVHDAIHQIVEHINSTLLSEIFSKGNFSGSKLFTIGYPELVTEGETTKPVVYGLGGEDMTYDDNYPVCLYHRQLATPVAQNTQASFGRGNDNQTETANMIMIVWANRSMIKIHESTLASWIGSVLGMNLVPSVFLALGLSKVTITPINYNFDSNAIHLQEFKINKPFGIENEYFQINYKIESTYTKSCFATCCN